MISLEKKGQNQDQMKNKLTIFHLLNPEDCNFVRRMIVFTKKGKNIKIKIFRKWKWLLTKVNQVQFQDNQVEVATIFIIYFKRKPNMPKMLK